MSVVNDLGAVLDATFAVEEVDGAWSITFESRGTSDGVPRNRDYLPALEEVLKRLASMNAVLLECQLVSRVAMRLPAELRRLYLGRAYPISLASVDIHQLRLDLTRAQAQIRSPGARGGGNPTKRIMLRVQLPGWSLSVSELTCRLADGVAAAHGGQPER